MSHDHDSHEVVNVGGHIAFIVHNLVESNE